MFCPRCGTQIAMGAKFCPRCGTPLGAVQPQLRQASPTQQYQPYRQPQIRQSMPAQPQYAAYQSQARRTRKKRGFLKTAVSVIAFVIVLNIGSNAILTLLQPTYENPLIVENGSVVTGTTGGGTTGITGTTDGSSGNTGNTGNTGITGNTGGGSTGGIVNIFSQQESPKWVGLQPVPDVDPAPLYDRLNEGEKAIYDALKNHFEGDDSYDNWLNYDGLLDDVSEDRAIFAYSNDNPYIGDIFDYLELYVPQHYSDGSNRFRFDPIRDYRSDYREMKAEAERVAASLSGSRSQMVRQINDYLADRNVYVKGAEVCHSTYSALILGETVCQGYSGAFAALCNEVGIPNYLVWGHSLDSSGEPTGGHAWNIVQLEDGNWYEIDVTWNDSGSDYDYFCIPTSQIEEDHRRDYLMYGWEDIVPVTQEPSGDARSTSSRALIGALRGIADAPHNFADLFEPEMPAGDLDLGGTKHVE